MRHSCRSILSQLLFSENLGNARALIVGFATCCVLETHFYLNGGCQKATDAKHDYGHQVSNQMCCTVDWWIGAIGMGSAGFLALLATRSISRGEGVLGSCCSCFVAPVVAVCQGLSASGLIILAVAQMCWRVHWHALGASIFFGFGILMSALVIFTPRSYPPTGRRKASSIAARLLVAALMAATLLVSYVAQNFYIAEWLLIMGIAAALGSIQMDLLFGGHFQHGDWVTASMLAANNKVLTYEPPEFPDETF